MACLAAGVALAACLPAEAAAPGANCRHSACREGASCRDLVNAKGLKGATWTTEYHKCMANPQGYH
jgi:hypothetical protein